MDAPNQFTNPVAYRRWQWTKADIGTLAAHRADAIATLAYLDKNHAIQRANSLNPPAKQAELERRNRAPHLAIVAEIDAELASRYH